MQPCIFNQVSSPDPRPTARFISSSLCPTLQPHRAAIMITLPSQLSKCASGEASRRGFLRAAYLVYFVFVVCQGEVCHRRPALTVDFRAKHLGRCSLARIPALAIPDIVRYFVKVFILSQRRIFELLLFLVSGTLRAVRLLFFHRSV